MASSPIAVTALTGFLGSGKTTLMNYILEHNHGLKIGVVVNDYGDINIDSQLVADQTDQMLELTNGCICCTMDSLELDEAIGQFGYPGSPIDYIIIEASGLAEPADLARTLRDAMNPQTKLDSIVAVLDAANLEHSADTRTTAISQIEHSDFVIINKLDVASPAQVDRAKALVADINLRARVLTATNAEIDVRLLLDQDVRAELPAGDGHNHNHRHLHEEYATTSFATDRPLDPEAFQSFVNRQIPTAVYRAKGIVNLGAKGHDRKYLFHLVGKRAELTWTEWRGQPPRTELVFIGKGFNAGALQDLAAACIDPHPRAVDPARRVALPRSKS